MRSIAIAAGSIATALVAAVYPQESAGQVIYERQAVSYQECWNPRAGHFERVRPWERQGDLDFSRCRFVGQRWRDTRGYGLAGSECWNPRAGHYERVRPGEIQNDLDFGRCRMTGDPRYEARINDPLIRECWNWRRGHFEVQRPGEFQEDLDLRRCRMVPESSLYAHRR